MDTRQLRVSSEAGKSCSYCSFFRVQQAAYPHDDGVCDNHVDRVRGDFLCESFLSTQYVHARGTSYDSQSQPEPMDEERGNF